MLTNENLPQEMVKLEKKKKKAKRGKEDSQLLQDEIQYILENQQQAGSSPELRDKAVELAEQSSIRAKEVTQKDVKRLRRLRRKAEREEKALAAQEQARMSAV